MRPEPARAAGLLVWAMAVALSVGCGNDTPTGPLDGTLSGEWTGALANGPCLGDWSSIEMSLEQSGESLNGILKTRDGQRIPLSGTFADGRGNLTVLRPEHSEDCPDMALSIVDVVRDRSGRATGFSSEAHGRCCGPIEEAVEFARPRGE